MCICRKLEEVHRELDLLAAQGKTAGFLTNAESAQRVNGLVEDIRQVMMDYQVRASTCPPPSSCLTNVVDFTATGYI